ncbi:hypothetical protein FBZ90_10385 [Nitrospirillum pindoramense]|uniref:Uncharacterized protein n=1 Tax=Nitrospirillum amazonense TaxID=28077 RepID=A0A560HEV4_9PROT|nr:hypothetical protein FBZ90_10385 [Nitrospirillum amazonense]
MTKPSLRTMRRYRLAAARRASGLLSRLRRLSPMEASEQIFRAASALALAEAVFGDRSRALAWLRHTGYALRGVPERQTRL